MDASAGFGYGFKITNKKLIEKINEEELDLDKDLDVMFHGDDESEILFICIKKSSILLCNWDDPKYFSSDKLIAQEGWDERLFGQKIIKYPNLKLAGGCAVLWGK